MNPPKRSITVISLAAIISMLSLVAIQEQAFATAQQGMSLIATTNAGSNTISISGHTAEANKVVSITVTSPNGNIVTVEQVTPNANGDFMTQIKTGGSLWKENGLYKITAQQSTALMYKLSVQVEIIGGTTTETFVSESSLLNRGTEGILTSEKLPGLTISVDAPLGATTITVTGHTNRATTEVSIVVKAPNGNVVTTDQVTPNANGDFMTKIQTNSPLWKQNGFYTITAHQVNLADYKASAQVEIANGAVIPEFGAVAALILAVAIISIIAVSARSRLSILPRY